MWPSTSWKNIPPYLRLLVSLSFSTNNVCKNAVFFLAVSFPKKAFVSPNNRISEARICRQCWLKKISRKQKTKQQKKLRDNVFLLSPRSRAKKIGLKSHLRASCTQPFNYWPLKGYCHGNFADISSVLKSLLRTLLEQKMLLQKYEEDIK